MNKIQVTGTLNKFKNRTTFSRAPCDGVATNMDTLGVLELAQEEAEEHRNRVARRRALRIFKDRCNPLEKYDGIKFVRLCLHLYPSPEISEVPGRGFWALWEMGHHPLLKYPPMRDAFSYLCQRHFSCLGLFFGEP